MAPQRRVLHLLQAVWLWMLAPPVSAYFMGDSKAVLNGCRDRWTLQDRGAMPRLFRMTVCVHVRVLSPGAWVAFSYRSPHAPRPELGLEGDDGALYAWLLGVRHRFPTPLALDRWQQVCLRRNVPGNTFSLHVRTFNDVLLSSHKRSLQPRSMVERVPVAERTVIANAMTPSGSLLLGCRLGDRPPRDVDVARIELYLFRVWSDLDDHALCEDGSVIGWDSRLWGVTSSRARRRDDSLACGERFALPGEGLRVTSASTNQQPPIDPTANTSEASDTSTTASAHKITDYTSQPTPLNPSVTMATSTNVTPSTTVSTGSLATVEGVVTMPIPSPVSQAPPFSDVSTANQITGYTQSPPITAQPAFQIPPPIPLPLGSSAVKCDITPFCTNDVAHYWMLISVEAETSGRAETDVIRWASTVFGCDSSTYTYTQGPRGQAQGGPRLVCQGDGLVQELQVSCEKEKRSRCADCSVLMRFSYPVPVCGLQYQMTRSFGKDLQICSSGQVERVGRGLCGEVAPSSGGFVRCSPLSSLVDVCQSGTPSNFTCSPLQPGTIRVALPERDLCSLRCGSGLSARVLLGSSQVWMAGALGGQDPCRDQHPVLCDPSRTQALILTDSCPIPPLMPSMANQSMLLPYFLRDTNFTGFPKLRLPPLEYQIPSDMNTTTAGPMATTTPEPLSTAVTQHTSLQSTPTPTVPLNTSPSSDSSLGLTFTTRPVTEITTPTTQTVVDEAEVIQSAAPDQVQVENMSFTGSSSLTSLHATARSDPVPTHSATQIAALSTAPTVGSGATVVVTTTAPDSPAAVPDAAAATPRGATEAPAISWAPASSVRYDATTLAPPVGPPNATAPPRSFSTLSNHTAVATTTVEATQTLRNTTVLLPTGPNATGIPGNGTVLVATVTAVAADNGTLQSAEWSSAGNPTLLDATTAALNGRTANHSAAILPDETTTVGVVVATDRGTPLTDPTAAAMHDPQTYTDTTVNVRYSVTMTQTPTHGPNPSITSIAGIDTSSTTTTTTTTLPPAQSPVAAKTPSSMTGSDQHSKNASTHTPATALLTNHTVATESVATESLPSDTTISSTNMSATTTGNISLGATETSEHTRGQEEEAKELEIQSQKVSKLNSSQVEGLVGRLERLLDKASVPLVVGRIAVRAISNLMEGHHLAISSSTNRLIHSVDQLALKLEVEAETLVLSASSLALAVRTLDGSWFPETSLSLTDPAHLQVSTADRSLPQRSEVELASVYLPSSLLESLTPAEQVLAVRVQFTFYTTPKLFQDVRLGNQTLVSPVLGSSVTNLSISNLRENIQFSIRSPHNKQASVLPRCVFWDFSLNGGLGGWNPEGCSVLNVTDGKTTCSCNHLTSFAVLLDLSRGGVSDRQHGAILTFITYIGCGVSAVFLSITLLTYMCFRKLLRDIPSKILVQLCLSLLLLNLVFLLDGWLALFPAPGLCISTAFFLHYFLLTSFTWAGLEALHMYLSIVRVFTPYLSRYMLRFSLMGWGIPMTVVVVIISVDKDNYGLITYGKYTDGTTDDFCWLRNNIAFYIGVVAYFLVVFILCLVVFTVVLAQLARIKRQNPHNQSPQRSLITDLRSVAGLILLLGLTWGFALFAWGPLHLPFVYLFSIFNSLQGFFIFFFHCAVKENVRRQWRTYLCCGRLRLAENSEWSRTATQNPKKQSVAVITSIALSPASRSSSLSSEMTNSFGSDSGISDSYNGDVVLNEIHRRNMAALS